MQKELEDYNNFQDLSKVALPQYALQVFYLFRRKRLESTMISFKR